MVKIIKLRKITPEEEAKLDHYKKIFGTATYSKTLKKLLMEAKL